MTSLSPATKNQQGQTMTHEAESELVARLRRHKGSGFNKCQDAADRIQELEAQIADYEKVLGDKRRLAREIDVAMHGEEGAAQQVHDLCNQGDRVIHGVAQHKTVVSGLAH